MRTLSLIAAAAAVVLLLAQAGNSASHPVGWYCSPTADVTTIFTNFPVDSVSTADGATAPTFTTNGAALCVDSIETSHVNDPAAGTVGLTPIGGSLSGQGGPWKATAANGIWTATPSQGTDTAVIQGTYACLDSNPATWTYSQADSTKTGFCRVTGRAAQADTTPPTVSFDSPTAGSLLHGTVRFNFSASDGASGIEHLEVQTSAPNAGSWTKRATGTDVLDWNTTNVPDGTYDVRVVAFDIAGNSTPTAAISLTIDNTPPQITLTCDSGSGPAACSDGWYSTAVDVNAVASDAHPSGQLRYTTDGTNPFVSPTAQTFDAPIHVTSLTVLTFGIADAAGNLATVQRTVKIDQTPPPAPTVRMGSASQFAFVKTTRANAYTVYHRSVVAGQVQLVVPTTDDPESGVQSVDFPTSFVLPTWHAADVQPTAATYAWDANPGEPSTITIASRNAAGLLGPTSDISFVADDSAPTGSIACVPASCSSTTGPVTVNFSSGDTGSGLKQIRYTTDGSDPSPTNGTVGTSLTVTSATPTIKFWAVDNVGNAAITSGSVAEAHSAAGTFDVNTTADTPDASKGNGVCADAAGACSLRAAVEEANTLPAGSTINVPSGSYQLTAGALVVQNAMTIAGAGARTTSVVGIPSSDRSSIGDRVFYVTAAANGVTISGLTLTGGTATPSNDFFGGDVRNDGSLILREDTLTNGSAYSGGGVGNAGGTLLIQRSTIVGNSATFGGADSGGVQNWGDGATHHGALTIENSTITGNHASLGGGVFDWNDPADTILIKNSTIVGNQGGSRGIGGIGIGNGSTAKVENTIVAGNTVSGAPNNCSGVITSGGHNLESGTDCAFTAAGDLQNSNPQLGSAANNGGPTDTLLPAATSPAVDAGDDGLCPGTDQRGTSRPQGGHCDIGAVEIVRSGFVVINTNDSGDGSLRQAILSANAQAGADTITFAIPGAGVHTITPASPLPPITDAVTIDGYTQPGAQPNSAAAGLPTDAVLDVVLDGDSVGTGAGLELTGAGSTVRGLVVNGGFLYGIEIDGTGATNNAVVGNYIGTTADGATAKGLGIYGVLIAGAAGNRVGGTARADRNVISGTTGVSDGGGVGVGLALGALRNTVVGNLIGLSADSTTYVPNATGLMVLSGAKGNVVGDGDKNHGNVISGNRVGVRVQQSGTTGNVFSGNWIGVTFVLDNGQRIDSGNAFDGVQDTESADGNTFSNNIVANNGGAGISVTGATGVRLQQNGIRDNGGLGIDLGGDGVTSNDAGDRDLGANNLQNFPVITDAGANGTVTGTLNSAPVTQYTIEVFGSPVCDPSGNGEGQGPAGSTTVTTDDAGNATFTIAGSFGTAAAYATATATGPDGATSEFSTCFRLSQAGSVLTVNSAADTDDGSCSSANCTLREAINAANAHAGADAIRFAILSGPQVIHVTSPLPSLTGATTLDGTSQPGWVAAPIVTVDGSGVAADGIVARGASSVVRGLVVDGFGGIGIHVFGDGSTIAGNYAGITASGTGVLGNGGDGIRVEGASGVTVGGFAPVDRNVVGGSGTGHGIFLIDAHGGTVRGNYSGTDASGAATAGNGLDGIAVDGGGSNTITGNVASGNHGQGISLFTVNSQTGQTSRNVVRGNVVSSNSGDGIRMASASNSTIGGSVDGQGNTVRGNAVAGVSVQNETSAGNTISGNSIDTLNGRGPAIDLRDGSNGGQPAPTITATDAAHVGGTLAGSAPSTTYTIEVFQSPAPTEGSCTSEAVTYLGSATTATNGSGAATWSVPVSVDPGSVATATATSASGNTSELSACFQTTVSATLDVAFTVDQSSTTAGAQSFALDSLPPQLFTQLATGDPASAPIPSAPIPSAAVGAAPIPSAPIPSAPIPSAPIPSAPIPSAPIPSAPIPSAPIPSAGLGGLPIPSADVANPLDAILLSSLPNLDVTAMFAGTSIAGKLPQQYTLGDVYRTPSALAYLTSHYVAADLNLGGTFLRGVRTLSYLLGGKTLNQIDIGQDWCTALANAGGSCAGVDVTKTTVIGLDIMGQLGSLDLGGLKVSNLTNGLNGTLVGNARIARIAFQQTTMAKLPVSSVPGITTCTTCATLGDAAAANAIVDVPTTLQQLGSLLNNVTFSELVVAMTPRSALPWEQESFVGWQGFGGQAQKLQYHLDFDATCPISAGLSVRVRLPFGFVYVPGSTSLQVGAAAATAVVDPALDPKSGATWTGLPVVGCTTGQREHLRLNFQGEPGYKLGASLSTATITANGDTAAITDAPVFVNRNWTAALDRSTEPAIAKDTILLSHVDSAGGTNYFKFPEQGRGKLVTIYMKPPAGADFDLYVVRPSPASLLASPIPSAPIPSAPIPSAPIPSAPIPSADTSVNTTTDNPPPELLDDGPLPGGEVSVDSITRSAGGVEAVTFRQAGSTGFDEIAVAGYNGAYSDQPFELRVQVQDPPALPANCPVRAITPVSPGTLPVGVDPATQNLALVNVGRMNAMYGTSRTQTMLNDLQTVLASAHGAVIPIDGNADVAAAAHAWDLAPCSIDAANNYVHAINALVATYRATLNNLHSITLVGDDEQIPSARVADFVPTSSEFDNTNALAFLTQGGTVDDAAYAAAALGYVLTDDAYGAFHTRQLFGHEFFLPEVAVGRLVETPEEIDGQLQQYIHASGVLSPTTGFVTGYDFMSDGAKAVDDGLAGRIGATPSATNTLLQDTWGKSALQPLLNGSIPTAKIDSWNAHYDFHRLMPAVYTGPSDLLTTDLVPAAVSQRFKGDIFFTMGCHAGQSLADTLFANATQTHDWAQAYSAGGAAVFIGNSGFGYGDTASVALSERLMSVFAGHLAFNGSIGEKLLQTKNDYFSSMGVYGPYDEKSLEEATFYGLPFWQVNSPGESAPTPPGPLSAADANGIKTAPLTITPHLTKVTDPRGSFWKAGDGTVFVQGRTIQPLVTTDVTQPASGYVAHGFFPSALVTDDSNKDVDLYYAKPMIDQASHEPEPGVTNDVFPASPVKVAQADYLGARHSTLDVIAGQSRPGSKPALQNERLITSLGGVVTYAPASATDYTAPIFGQTGSFVSGGTATIFATVTDNASAGVIKVRAFFTTGGPWQFVDLAPLAGSPNVWQATGVAVSTDKIEVGFVAEDASGNTGWMTGKGILVESFTPSAPPAAPGITIKQPLDGGSYNAGQSVPASYSCTSVVVIKSCVGTVANGAPIDTSTVGPKQFTVTATPLVGDAKQKTVHYDVVYFFGGFQPPISSTGLNSVKAGNSVPVKFSLHGNYGLNILAPGYPQSGPIPCTGVVDAGLTTDTSGNSTLTYDTTSDTYTYSWKTDKSWKGCRQLLVVLNDGVVHRANFQFK